jgi:hypothetical protein
LYYIGPVPTRERPELSASQLQKATTKPKPIISGVNHLYKEVMTVLAKDQSGRNPREVIETYIYNLEPEAVSYYFRFLIENDVYITMSGNLKPTTPRRISAMYLRVYLWEYLRLDSSLKKKYETTIFANSFV